MNYVQPIRDIPKIEEMKDILKRKNYRDYFLFLFGINSGLRIRNQRRRNKLRGLFYAMQCLVG